MRRTLFASLILVFLALPAFSQFRTGYSELEDSDMVRTLRSHVTYLSSPEMEGRAPGSEGEKAAAGYVQSVLESYGIDILSGEEGDIFGISRESGDTLVSRNVAGFVPGYDNSLKDRFIVVGIVVIIALLAGVFVTAKKARNGLKNSTYTYKNELPDDSMDDDDWNFDDDFNFGSGNNSDDNLGDFF